jgi:predicted DNA-binding transcriptional regulator YafY
MAKWANAVRILKIRELMHDYSDENHPLTIKEITDHLRNQLPVGYDMPSISTLESDLGQLTTSGFVIHQESSAHNTFLYHHKKTFSQSELRMLLDAVASARFISGCDTEELSSKIRRLGGHYLGHEMNSMIKSGDRLKQNGEGLHLVIQTLHKAIADHKTVKFTYGKYYTRLEFLLNRNGESYQLDPYELFWNSDYYYLI